MQTRAATSLQTRAVSSAGFNLIEAAIVLGIVGLIVGGIWAAAGSAYENMRLQNASKSMLALVQGIRSIYANNPDANVNVDVNVLANMGVIPGDMLVLTGGAHIVHQWNANILTEDSTAESSGTPSFKLTYQGLKRDSCNNLAARVANTARGSGLLKILTQSGGNPYLDLVADPGATPAGTGPQCADPDNMEIIFNIRG